MSKLRLFTKRETDVEKAKDRMREIQEGAKLAKRVDDLRKLHAEEERNYLLFKESTAKLINSEIGSLLEKRDSLRKEVELLEEKKKLCQ